MKQKAIISAGIGLLLAVKAYSQCVTPASSNFGHEVISNGLNHPVAMSLVESNNQVAAFVAEMWTGKVKFKAPGSNGFNTVLTLSAYIDGNKTSTDYNSGNAGFGVENGLLGVAAHPKFNTNRWVFVLYSKKIGNTLSSEGDGNIAQHQHVLSRFTYNGQNLISEKEILTIPRLTARHAGGALDFDEKTEYLYITTGDDRHPSNTKAHYGPRSSSTDHWDALETSANTNDLRGKVLRIKPIDFKDSENPSEGIGRTYTIPEGNLYPEGTDSTRAEVYTMGHRNPYRIRVDAWSGWAMIGEVGPDGRNDQADRGLKGHEEYNLVTKAANYGWPFFIADSAYIAYNDEPYAKGTVFQRDNLLNLSSRNKGKKLLPVPVPPVAFHKGGGSYIGGPIYKYENTSLNAGRLPAYFNGKAIVGNWSTNQLALLEFEGDQKLKKKENLSLGKSFGKVIDIDVSTNGELYILQYGAGGGYHGNKNSGILNRVYYKGSQYNSANCSHFTPPEAVYETGELASVAWTAGQNIQLYANLSQLQSIHVPEGVSQIGIYDVKGQALATLTDLQDQQVIVPSHLSHEGMVYLKFQK